MVTELEKRKSRNLVIQSNSLVQGYYETDFNATEHKIIRYAVAKISKDPGKFPYVEFSIQEFLRAAGVKGENYYSEFERIAEPLGRKQLKVRIKKGNNKSGLGVIQWFSNIFYLDGAVSIKFNEDVKPLILALEKEFTQYNFEYIGDMRSAHTIRLFELLKQYQAIGKRTVEIDELKKMLGLEGKYKRYNHLKERVVLQAKKELDKKGGLTFDFEEIKKGRKVHALKFDIKVNQKQLDMDDFLFQDDPFASQVRPMLESYKVSDKISDNKIKEWEKYGVDAVSNALEAIDGRDDVGAPGSYLTTVLENNAEATKKNRHPINVDGIDEEHHDYVIKNITRLINQYKDDFNLPPNYVHNKMDEVFADMFTRKEIYNLWKQNEEYIEKVFEG